jgi:hypothetical protein
MSKHLIICWKEDQQGGPDRRLRGSGCNYFCQLRRRSRRQRRAESDPGELPGANASVTADCAGAPRQRGRRGRKAGARRRRGTQRGCRAPPEQWQERFRRGIDRMFDDCKRRTTIVPKENPLSCALLVPQFDCAVPAARGHLARVDRTPLTTNRDLIVTLELSKRGAQTRTRKNEQNKRHVSDCVQSTGKSARSNNCAKQRHKQKLTDLNTFPVFQSHMTTLPCASPDVMNCPSGEKLISHAYPAVRWPMNRLSRFILYLLSAVNARI